MMFSWEVKAESDICFKFLELGVGYRCVSNMP